MDLLEYQAKALFRDMGIPVLPSERIYHPKDLKGLTIPYPVVLKSQVPTGGRGKAGGIKFAENTIDAVAAAQTIFQLPIVGEYPEVVLAEAKYNADQEFYLAVVLDTGARRPLLLGSRVGGIDAEAAMEQMQLVVVDQEFSPFYARRLALKMGLQGGLIQAVSNIVQKMYGLFVQKDLDLVEINPLGVSATGQVMALDGKVTLNDDALGRHSDLVILATKNAHCRSSTRDLSANAEPLRLVQLEGNIGLLCNGGALTMTTLDLIYKAGGMPANFVNVGGDAQAGWIPAAICSQIERGLELIAKDASVRVLLVNAIGSLVAGDRLAAAIASFWQRRSRDPQAGKLQAIVRLVASDPDRAKALLESLPVTVVESLDEAVDRAISLAN